MAPGASGSRARVLAVTGLATVVGAQGQFGAAPAPNNLLNDLRSIQFPPPGGFGGQPMGGGAPVGGGGLGLGGGLGFGGGLGGLGAPPQQPGFGGGAPMGQGFGGQPMGQGFGGQPMSQGFGGGAIPGTPVYGGGGFGQQPVGGGMPQASAPQGAGAPPDLACNQGPKAAGWQTAKQIFRVILEGEGGPMALAPRELLTQALQETLRVLKSVGALDTPAEGEPDCGLGKLSLQLLSFLVTDDPAALVQLFMSFEPLASPVLTMLLDVPMVVTGESGWPVFGLLAQINLRKGQVPGALNTEEIDGLNEQVGRELLGDLIGSLSSGDPNMLQQAAAIYLSQPSRGSALAPLTALSAQAYASQNAEERAAVLQGLQTALQQVVGNAAELDIALSTNWPLWGLLHLAVDGYYGGP